MDKQDSGDPKQSTADMTAFVHNLLQQMVSMEHGDLLLYRSSKVPANVRKYCFKVDEMGSRINELEESINDLRTEMGAEGSPSPMVTKQKPDEAKPEEGPPA